MLVVYHTVAFENNARTCENITSSGTRAHGIICSCYGSADSSRQEHFSTRGLAGLCEHIGYMHAWVVGKQTYLVISSTGCRQMSAPSAELTSTRHFLESLQERSQLSGEVAGTCCKWSNAKHVQEGQTKPLTLFTPVGGSAELINECFAGLNSDCLSQTSLMVHVW